MKKAVGLVFLLIFLFSTVVMGADKAGDVEFGAGAEFLNLDYTPIINGEKSSWTGVSKDIANNLSSPIGGYLTGVYWVKKNFGLEVGGLISSSSYSGQIANQSIEKKDQLRETYGELTYYFNDYFSIKAGASYLYLQKTDKIRAKNFNQVIEKGSGVGFRGEVGFKLPLVLISGVGSIYLSTDVIYRVANIQINEVYDDTKDKLVQPDNNRVYRMNPLSIRLGASYRF